MTALGGRDGLPPIISAAARLLWTPGEVHELRIPGTSQRTVNGYYVDVDRFAAAAARWSGLAPGVYATINPVNPALLARSRNSWGRARQATGDADIVRRRWLPLDFDPVRPSGTSSTNREHELALRRGRACYDWLIELGFPAGALVLADSGNGAHVLVRIDLENSEAATALIRGCIEAVAARFGDDAVSVDRTIGNAARIWKVYGTLARKGNRPVERPWRRAMILRPPIDGHEPNPPDAPNPASLDPRGQPDGPAPVVAGRDLLERLQAHSGDRDGRPAGGSGSPPFARPAVTSPTPGVPGRTTDGSSGTQPGHPPDQDHPWPLFDLEGFIERHLAGQVSRMLPWSGGQKWVLRACPFNPEHVGTSAAIFRGAGGKLGFRCLHNSCRDRDWHALRRLLEGTAVPAPGGSGDWAAGSCARTVGAAAPEGPGPSHLTDTGNAVRLIMRHGNDLRYCSHWSRWLVWNGRVWTRDMLGEVMEMTRETVMSIHRDAAATADPQLAQALRRHATRSEARGRLDAMVNVATTIAGIAIPPEAFDGNPWLLNCRNGTLDLLDGRLRPHDRADLITKCTAVDYDPSAPAPGWLAFLERVCDGHRPLIDFLQRALGYSLTGDTSEEALFFVYGSGRNGKSKFLGAVERVLGDYARTTRPETFMAKMGGDIPNDVAALAGARFVPTVEMDAGRKLSESLVKQLSGGDTVSARFLHGEFFNFQFQGKIWLAANQKPRVEGTDNGIWERIRLIPFTVTIPAAERDKRLAEKLAAEGPGILAWMVEGCRRWRQVGLNPPSIVQRATAAYREEMDGLAAFLMERCEMAPELEATAGELYDAYRGWCETTGERTLSQRRLAGKLNERGLERRKTNHSVIYRGVGVHRPL